jgi:endoglucanase
MRRRLPLPTLPLLGASLAFACTREPPPAAWLQPTPTVAPNTPEAAAAGPRKPAAPFAGCDKTPVSELIRVDQFGYRPGAKKVAILVDPVEGWNASQELVPGKVYEVRSWDDGRLVLSGAPQPWNQGAVQKNAGDRGAWFDFSFLSAEGSYCVVDRENGLRSYRFDVKRSVYRDVLRAATKMFYFQRANFAKQKPWACVGSKCWTAKADYVGPRQDKEARSVKDRGNAGTARDLTGGWWDAGDVNKYVTFAQPAVHQLLSAYTDKPGVFSDDFGIPESGNGVPDVLDEVRVELEWLKKMQPADLNGGVLLKVGNLDHGDPIPERSTFPRFYYPEPCSSSTVVAASIFAHASLVFATLPTLKGYADELSARAKRAFSHFQQKPRKIDCDDGTIRSGDGDKSLAEQEQASVVAAIYLFALTGEQAYADVIAKSYQTTRPMQEDRWSSYDPEQGEALLFYAGLPNADASIKAAILSRKLTQSRTVDIYGMKPELDLYRAYMREDSFHWAHSQVRANVGNTNYELLLLGPAKPADSTTFSDRAEGLLNSFHGVNAMGVVYLTNMSAYGAEKSVNQIFHTWYRDGDPDYDDAQRSRLGPPPGYVPGGPNHQYCASQPQSRCVKSRLKQQPAQKAFLDFNTGWEPTAEHDQSWEITEPGIYYQASYVMLLSKFVE